MLVFCVVLVATGVSTMAGRVTAGSPQHAGRLRLTGPLQGQGPIWALATATLPNGTFVVAAGGSNGKVTWWNGASGELLSDATSADPHVVRSMAAMTLPDGRIRFATGHTSGTVQLWDGAQGVTVGRVISSAGGPVWSMAALTVPGPRAVLFTGWEDGRIRRWDAETGELVGEPFGDHAGPVRAMTAGAPADGRPTLVTGGDDGTVRRWDAETGHQLGPVLHSAGGPVWGVTIARMPAGPPIVVGDLCRVRHKSAYRTSSGNSFSASRKLFDTVLAASRPMNVPTCGTPSTEAARMHALRWLWIRWRSAGSPMRLFS